MVLLTQQLHLILPGLNSMNTLTTRKVLLRVQVFLSQNKCSMNKYPQLLLTLHSTYHHAYIYCFIMGYTQISTDKYLGYLCASYIKTDNICFNNNPY